MPDTARFIVFMTAAFLLFLGLLRFVVRTRQTPARTASTLILAFIVVVAGMLFARYSHIASPGIPWQIYYGLPALTTVLLPPIWLRMRRSEILLYLPLAFLIAPAIHIFFSFAVGWHDYMPFPIYIPSIAELVHRAAA